MKPGIWTILSLTLAVSTASAQIVIDNDITGDGFYNMYVNDGGNSTRGEIDPIGNGAQRDVIFDYSHHIDVGADGSAVRLSSTTITTSAFLSADDQVTSAGTFAGSNGTISWTAVASIADGSDLFIVEITFTSPQPFGTVRLIQYLDEDVGAVSDDQLVVVGTSGGSDFQLLTVDGAEKVGVAQGAFFSTLSGMTYAGWHADEYADLITAIGSATPVSFSVSGVIDTTDLPARTDANFPDFPVYGLADVTTAFGFDLDPTATTATIKLFLGGSADGTPVDLTPDQLASPIYSKWNTFLGQKNFLELINAGTKNFDATVTLYNLFGAPMITRVQTLESNNQSDLDINALVASACENTPSVCSAFEDLDGNGVVDTYGLARVSFDDTDSEHVLLGRISNYLENDDGSYSFAYARELKNGKMGTTYSTGNTVDAQGLGYIVNNWLEVINLDTASRSFTYNLYDALGVLLNTDTFTLAPLAERDFLVGESERDANGNVPEAAYLVEIVPDNNTAPYAHYINRISSNSTTQLTSTYSYAAIVEGQAGDTGTLYAPITREDLSLDCAVPTSWVEVVNVSDETVTLSGFFRNSTGQVAGALIPSQTTLTPKAQAHFNPTALLPLGAVGAADVSTDSDTAKMLMQTVVYYHNCDANTLQTAFLTQGESTGGASIIGSVNTFLNMDNFMRIIRVGETSVEPTLSIRRFDGSPVSGSLSVPGNGLTQLQLNGDTFDFNAGSLGVVSARTPIFRRVVGQVIRVRRATIDGRTRLDFVLPTQMR